MEVICLEEDAFYALVENVVNRLKLEKKEIENKWIGRDEAMKYLRIKSKTTFQKLRNTGQIRFSQPNKKMILYDRDSLQDYLEQNSKDTF